MPAPIEVYDGLDSQEIERLARNVETSLGGASISVAADDEIEPDGQIIAPQISPMADLIGIDPEVYRQINDALAGGFRHLLFYGPPGTGKTTLAQRVAGEISERWKLITGSADWTSQDILGGYYPLADGKLIFVAGVLLEYFDRPLIFDELNRCDIDKVIGPLFTVLSGQSTTLPYFTDPTDPLSPRIEILPKGQPDVPRVYAPTQHWKLIATINSIDKASLYQMSYALTRRFAWIYIDAPRSPHDFIREFVRREPDVTVPDVGPIPLADLWTAVNEVRVMGAAPVIDIIRLIRTRHPAFNFFASIPTPDAADPYLDGFYVFLLPMLDGILQDQGDKLADTLAAVLELGNDARGTKLRARIRGLTI